MPILILLRVAPFVGELPLHGSGAILIRELTRRAGPGELRGHRLIPLAARAHDASPVAGR